MSAMNKQSGSNVRSRSRYICIVVLCLIGCNGSKKIIGHKDITFDDEVDLFEDDVVESELDVLDIEEANDDVLDIADLPDTGEISDVIEDAVFDCTEDLGVFVPIESAAYCEVGFVFWETEGYTLGGSGSLPESFLNVQSYVGGGGPDSIGTYHISGLESGYACNLCIYKWENCSPVPDCEDYFLATTATLDITSIGSRAGEYVVGSLTGAYFQEWDPTSDSIVTDGKSYCLERWDFDLQFDWS